MHRLDRDTAAHAFREDSRYCGALKEPRQNSSAQIYLAAVPGVFPKRNSSDTPLREDPRATSVSMYPKEDGKPCKTIFPLRRGFEAPGNVPGPFSVVEAELVTGRKHQIRAHLASLGFPLSAINFTATAAITTVNLYRDRYPRGLCRAGVLHADALRAPRVHLPSVLAGRRAAGTGRQFPLEMRAALDRAGIQSLNKTL